ncbi:hypothetical protein CRM22_000003 [Opisthorchis felineus]|uniref:Peptidase A1 domain-containing protein n=1 Tax=Opisthorchis felineus TaxID=147828 RepID=A0A4S2MH00_OPIFE|nr:hypothetical protein CRM22_000003 [Opisthorchis felineus]
MFVFYLIYFVCLNSIDTNAVNVTSNSPWLRRVARENVGKAAIELLLFEPEYFRLLFDTGSSIIWVSDERRSTELSMIKNAYDPNDSKTYINTGREFTGTYGNYVAKGHVAIDLVKIQSFKLSTHFAVVNNVQGHTNPFHLFDGLFGLAPVQFLSRLDSTSLDDMVTQGLISRHIFSFVFRRGGADGKIIFGEFSEKDIPEEVKYVPLLDTSVTGGHWMILTSMVLYENAFDWLTQLRTVVDTGTVKVLMPAPLVQSLLTRIWAQLRNNEYYVPCDAIAAMPMLIFQFEYFKLTWEPRHYILQISRGVCQPRFRAMTPGLPYDMLLGMALLRHYTTVFDVTDRRVGFAGPVDGSE